MFASMTTTVSAVTVGISRRPACSIDFSKCVECGLAEEDTPCLPSIHTFSTPKLLSSLSGSKHDSCLSTSSSAEASQGNFLASSDRIARMWSGEQLSKANGDLDETDCDFDIEGFANRLSTKIAFVQNQPFTPSRTSKDALEASNKMPTSMSSSPATSTNSSESLKENKEELRTAATSSNSKSTCKQAETPSMSRLFNMNLSVPVQMDVETYQNIRRSSAQSPMQLKPALSKSRKQVSRETVNTSSKKVSFSPNIICIHYKRKQQ